MTSSPQGPSGAPLTWPQAAPTEEAGFRSRGVQWGAVGCAERYWSTVYGEPCEAQCHVLGRTGCTRVPCTVGCAGCGLCWGTQGTVACSGRYQEPCRLPRWLRWYGSRRQVQETWDRSLGQDDPLEEGMATHSSVLAWRIPGTEEPGGLQSMGLERVRHD